MNKKSLYLSHFFPQRSFSHESDEHAQKNKFKQVHDVNGRYRTISFDKRMTLMGVIEQYAGMYIQGERKKIFRYSSSFILIRYVNHAYQVFSSLTSYFQLRQQ
jgi:hypothetical protein